MDDNKNVWGFAQIWNKSLEKSDVRVLQPRDHLWASELGKAPIDIFLKLQGIQPTNPPNARSLRKFEAGNVHEWVVSLVLKRANILKEAQRWSSFEYPGCLPVTGKADFIAGGIIDNQVLNTFQTDLENLDLPEVFKRAGLAIVSYLAQTFPGGLLEMPLEIKSVSSFMFEALERKGRSSKFHRMQLYHYLKSNNYPAGLLVYICRDDLRIMEFPIYLNSEVENEYREAIETVSKFVKLGERPPLEKPIIFDTDIGKFAKNFNIAYSGYLTLLYGFEHQMAFDNTFSPAVARWNRVLGRIKSGAKMTAKNEDVKKEILDAGYILEDILKEAVVEDEPEAE